MNKKRFKTISALLALALLLPIIGCSAHSAATEVPPMEDVSPDDWFYRYVMRGLDFGLITGTSNDSFRFEPNRPVTRAEFVTMLGRLHEHWEGNTIDTSADDTFYGRYLAWAAEHDIVRGNQHGDLMPNVLITREQMAVIVYRYIDVFELQPHLPRPHTHDSVPVDYQDVSNWARHEVLQMMYRYRLMQGTGPWPGLFNPQDNSSRAEALAVLVRLGDVLYNAARFVLTISAEETSLPQGDNFFGFYVELKNNSGQDLEIIVDILFWPHIPNWRSDEVATDMPERRTIFFPKNGVIRHEPWSPPFDRPARFGYGGGSGYYGDEWVEWLPVGTHELSVGAVFYIICEQGRENQRVGVRSDTIVLTVLPSVQ